MAFSYKFAITIDHTKTGSSDSAHFPVLFRSPIGTVNTSATAVTWVSGDTFPTWLAGLPIMINGTVYTVSSVTTSTALVLSTSAGTQTGVAFSGTPTLATVANGGHVQSSTGYDIYFYSDSSLTTRLPAEREIYTATGNYIGWINVTNVSHTADTTIYVAYGDSGISSDPNSDGTYGATSTWDSNYKGVWHLPNGTSLTANDSTSNGANGTITGVTAAVGEIDGGGLWHGGSTTDIVSAPYTAGVPVISTISAWMYVSAYDGTTRKLWSIDYNSSGGEVMLIQMTSAPAFQFSTAYYANSGAWTITQPSTGAWHLVTVSLDQSSVSNVPAFYVDGVAQSLTTVSTPSGSPTLTTSTLMDIGNRSDKTRAFNGYIDEVRLSTTIRSADWIKTEYNNQKNPNSFYAVGSEQSVGTVNKGFFMS